MADHTTLMAQLEKIKTVPRPIFSALTPNVQGFEAAVKAGCVNVAVLTAASETFNLRNLRCSTEDSMKRVADIMIQAKTLAVPVRGYVSTVIACPYEGTVEPAKVAEAAQKLLELGCYEVSLGDTIGVGTPGAIHNLLDTLERYQVPFQRLAVHFHDTYGQALCNVYAALIRGIRVVDSSVAGLGGCPFARGASGNLATEDLMYLLQGLEIQTGVSLKKVVEAGRFAQSITGTAASKV
eukprot:Filipodium_phascolosomae@DN2570_c0_g1_i5.p1